MVLQTRARPRAVAVGPAESVDLGRLGFGGFSFLGTPEPDGPAMPFIEIDAIRPDDHVIDLRGPEEAPVPVSRYAVRILPAAIPDAVLPEDRRIVLACSAGIRAHRAARTLAGRRLRDLAIVVAGP